MLGGCGTRGKRQKEATCGRNEAQKSTFFFSSRRQQTKYWRDWSSDVCSSDLNRALLELVCSAGLRAHEAVGLDLGDVEFGQEHVRVHGKGGKDRVVPLGEEAAYWLGRYLREARAALGRGAANAVFLPARGRRLGKNTARHLLSHPHLPRNAVPTHPLGGGAATTRL